MTQGWSDRGGVDLRFKKVNLFKGGGIAFFSFSFFFFFKPRDVVTRVVCL